MTMMMVCCSLLFEACMHLVRACPCTCHVRMCAGCWVVLGRILGRAPAADLGCRLATCAGSALFLWLWCARVFTSPTGLCCINRAAAAPKQLLGVLLLQTYLGVSCGCYVCVCVHCSCCAATAGGAGGASCCCYCCWVDKLQHAGSAWCVMFDAQPSFGLNSYSCVRALKAFRPV